MSLQEPKVITKPVSGLFHLDAYRDGNHVIFLKPEGDALYAGRAYMCSPLTGGGTEFSNFISNIFKTAPHDAVLQVSLLVDIDEDGPENYARGKGFGGPLIQEMVQRHTAHLARMSDVGWRAQRPPLNRRRVVISWMRPVPAASVEVAEEISQQHDEFLVNLSACGFRDAEPLTPSRLLGLYRHWSDPFTPEQDIPLDPTLEMRKHVFGPADSVDFRDTRLGLFHKRVHCAGVTCKAYPEVATFGVMNLVSGAPFNKGTIPDGGGSRITTPFIITTSVRVANQRKEHDRIEYAIQSRQNAKTLPIKLGNEDPKDKLQDLLTLRQQVSKDDVKVVFSTTTAFFFGKTKKQVLDASALFASTLDNLDFNAHHIENNAQVRWAQSLPLNYSPTIADALDGEAIMSSDAAGALLPVYGDYQGNVSPQGARTGLHLVTRRGQPIHLDPFISATNLNGLIAGTSGSGKSVVVQDLIKNVVAEGTHVVAFDNGSSLRKLTLCAGGEYNEFGQQTGYTPSLNPFTGLTDKEFDEQQETITALLLMMAYGSEQQDRGAGIAMNEAVKAAWGQKANKAEISNVISALETSAKSLGEQSHPSEPTRAAVNLIPRLKAFLESPTRGLYFRGKGTLDHTSQLTVFELGGLGEDEHLKKCVMFFVLSLVLNRIRHIKGRKLVLVDEAHDFMRDDGAAAVLEGLYERGRKDLVSTWIVLQSLNKLADLKAGRVILNQSAWKLILKHESTEIAEIMKHKLLNTYGDDAWFEKTLESVDNIKGVCSEIMVMGPDTYEVGCLFLDPFTSCMYSSEGANREAIFKLMDEGVSPVEAVETYMGDTSRKRAGFIRDFTNNMHKFYGLSPADLIDEIQRLYR